jgi:hypothetical protein
MQYTNIQYIDSESFSLSDDNWATIAIIMVYKATSLIISVDETHV